MADRPGITPATARLHGHRVTVYCDGPCRRGTPLDLGAFLLGPWDETPFGELARRRKFRCDGCGGHAATLFVKRVDMGADATLEEWRQV